MNLNKLHVQHMVKYMKIVHYQVHVLDDEVEDRINQVQIPSQDSPHLNFQRLGTVQVSFDLFLLLCLMLGNFD